MSYEKREFTIFSFAVPCTSPPVSSELTLTVRAGEVQIDSAVGRLFLPTDVARDFAETILKYTSAQAPVPANAQAPAYEPATETQHVLSAASVGDLSLEIRPQDLDGEIEFKWFNYQFESMVGDVGYLTKTAASQLATALLRAAGASE